VNVWNVSGATDYQSDHSVNVVDHMVNGSLNNDNVSEDGYEPAHHMANDNVQATPQKRRGWAVII